ncbi:pyrroline-5-carboxylate reductase [Alkalibacterium sp. f15]|uniref:pyrroline-5-carboxylate reductase n=1 Tax=Alkalibacterium sp. f15 TaxID=3414029 RepID=UPI003BF8B533
MKIGFIGFGNMAKAIAKGLIDNNVLTRENIYFSTRSKETRLAVEKDWAINGLESNQAVIDHSDVIVLAVKPHQVTDVLNGLDFSSDVLLLSIVAGYSSEQLHHYISPENCIRTMPNLNAQVNASMTALVENEQVREEDMKKAEMIFSAVGETVIVSEDQLGIFIALAGSSPALVFLFIDTLARTAVKHGMPKDKATKIAAQAVLGSGKTVKESSESPWNLIDQVSSPGGITVEAVLSLLEGDFSSSLIKAVDTMIEKNEEMTSRNTK